MKKNLILVFTLILISNPAFAAFKFGFSLPTRYLTPTQNGSLYSFDGSHSGKATGYNLFAFIPLLPGVGYETYSIEIQGTDLSEDPSLLSLQMYDVLIDFSDKDSSLYFGLGEGMTSFECKATSCQSLSFQGKRARQVFVSYGVPMGANSDFHLSARRVSAKISMISGTTEKEMDFSGWLLAFGLQVGF